MSIWDFQFTTSNTTLKYLSAVRKVIGVFFCTPQSSGLIPPHMYIFKTKMQRHLFPLNKIWPFRPEDLISWYLEMLKLQTNYMGEAQKTKQKQRTAQWTSIDSPISMASVITPLNNLRLKRLYVSMLPVIYDAWLCLGTSTRAHFHYFTLLLLSRGQTLSTLSCCC